MKIYVASSWRNVYQPAVVNALREWGHEVYDFRSPAPGNDGFRWSDVGALGKDCPPHQWREALRHPVAEQGFNFDFNAMKWADACVFVAPAGRSASFELGWCMGAGKVGYFFVPSGVDSVEPELMFRESRILIGFTELANEIGRPAQGYMP